METRLARLEERTENMGKDISEMKDDLREIRDAVVGARGGWKALLIMAGIAASIGAGFAWLLAYLKP